MTNILSSRTLDFVNFCAQYGFFKVEWVQSLIFLSLQVGQNSKMSE